MIIVDRDRTLHMPAVVFEQKLRALGPVIVTLRLTELNIEWHLLFGI